MLQELNYCGILAFFVFLTIGFVPLILGLKIAGFNIFHWGFFGMVGAVASTLRAFYRSDLLEIGNTEGSRELIRAFLGASMGFFSGAIAYLVIAGKIVGSSAVIPEIPISTLKDLSLSAFWAMASGFSFDKILDRFRTTVDGKIS